MKFDIKLKLTLEFLGEGWENCYMEFSPITVKEARTFTTMKIDEDGAEKAIQLVKDKFLTGKGVSNGVIVDIDKKDIEELPQSVILKSVELMVNTMTDIEKKTLN